MMVAGDTDQGLSRLCCGLISDNYSHDLLDQLTGSRQMDHVEEPFRELAWLPKLAKSNDSGHLL
jgi:hypothetical protein